MNLIKLTEIKSSASGYDGKTKNVVNNYALNNIYVNPSYVIFVKSNIALESLSKRNCLIEGMNEDMLFTQVALSAPGMSPTMVSVVGSPEQIIKKLEG